MQYKYWIFGRPVLADVMEDWLAEDGGPGPSIKMDVNRLFLLMLTSESARNHKIMQQDHWIFAESQLADVINDLLPHDDETRTRVYKLFLQLLESESATRHGMIRVGSIGE